MDGFSENTQAMQTSSNQNIDPKLTYDPSWTGPLKVKRSATNLYMLIPFVLVLINWVRVAYYAFEKGKPKNDIWDNAMKLLNHEKWIIVGTWMYSFFSSILLFVFLRVSAQLTIYVITSVFLLMNLSIISYYCSSIHKSKNVSVTEVSLLAALTIYTFFFILLCSINGPFIKKACEIIRETMKALIFFRPSLFLYSLLLYALSLVTTLFCAFVGVYLFRINEPFQSRFDYIFNQCSNVLGCIWLTSFFFAFFRVVISGTYSTWYWTTDKQEVPTFMPIRFIWITLRYHVGSVIAGSFITPIVKVINALGVSHPKFADPSEHHRFSLLRALQPCYNRIGMLTDLAYVYIALHGQEYCESAKTTFSIWRRNHTKFAAIDTFIRELIFMGFITIASLSLYLYLGLKYASCGIQSQFGIFLVFLFLFLLINSIFLLMDVAMDTVLICGLEDFEVNGNSSRPYYMSDKLKEIILENRME